MKNLKFKFSHVMLFLFVCLYPSSTSREIFIDGISLGTQTTSCTFSSSTDATAIGVNRLTSPNNYFNGSIDEVRIWNRSLTASEVYQQYVSNLAKYNSTDWTLYINQSHDYQPHHKG